MKLWCIVHKELVDSARDRRALVAALSIVLLGPIVLVISLNTAASRIRDVALTPFALCGVGAAPELVAYLQASGLTLAQTQAPSSAEPADICLDIPADYAQRMAAGRTAHLSVRADLTDANPTVEKLEREINGFARKLASQRLMARGVAPQVIAPIKVEMQSTNGVSRIASTFGIILILYMLYAPFIVVFAMAADTTAGERERHSLQSLLTHSVSALHIVLGKFMAIALVNVAGTALCIAVSLLLLEHSAVAELGLRVATDLGTGMSLCLLMIPLSLLAAAMQLVVGLLSKTPKEAQQSLMLFSLLPLFAVMALMNRPGLDVGAWPVGWEVKALAGPLLGSTTELVPFPIVAALELGFTALMLWAGTRRLHGESVIS